MKPISYTEFCSKPLPEKVDFFDNELDAIVQSVEESQLYIFLKGIILNIAENAHIRRSALSTLVESVFLGKVKGRQALSVLIDEWVDSSQVFVEQQRVKDLFYFWDIEPDIQNIYTSYLASEELEIVAEAQLNLGFIYLQKGFRAVSKTDKIRWIQTAIQNFTDSDNSIENRIDAKFYSLASSILLDTLSLKTANIDNQLIQLSDLLKEKWLYSFDFKENVMDISFYKTLVSVSNIIKENPTNWTEYSTEFNKLFEYYAEVKNQEIKNRLNKSNLSHAFVAMCEESFIEPYLALNFQYQIIKIENCLLRYTEGSPLHDFLSYIKKLAENNDFKKKVDTETIEQKLKNCFPQRSPVIIEKTLKKIKDPTNPNELIQAIEELSLPSIEKFVANLVSACLKLQKNRIYKGDFSEDDRNTYISDLLDGAGYDTKDQTRQGTSYAGKSAGEIDILIKDQQGLPFTIIEALNLKYIDKGYIKKHIEKLFNNYDTAGLENNFMVVYANVKDFGTFCKSYIDYIANHNYTHIFQSVKEIKDYRFADFKIFRAEHIRQGQNVFLYHIVINVNG
jgi:hypothetical protein